MTIGQLIDEILRAGWDWDQVLTNDSLRTWAFRRSDKPDPIVITGDVNSVLDPFSYRSIRSLACDDE